MWTRWAARDACAHSQRRRWPRRCTSWPPAIWLASLLVSPSSQTTKTACARQALSDASAALTEMLALPAERLLQQALRRTSLALRHIRHKQEAAAAAGQHKKQAGAGRAALRSEIKRELRRFRTPPALEPAW